MSDHAWFSQANNIQTNIIPHMNNDELKNILTQLSANPYFTDYFIKYNNLPLKITLTYLRASGLNDIEMHFYQPALSDDIRTQYKVKHDIFPDADEGTKFPSYAGVKEFVETRFQFNQDRYVGSAPQLPPVSALAWNTMDRLLDLLAQ